MYDIFPAVASSFSHLATNLNDKRTKNGDVSVSNLIFLFFFTFYKLKLMLTFSDTTEKIKIVILFLFNAVYEFHHKCC